MAAISAYLPDASAGYLPYWQLLVALTATGNALACIASPKGTRNMFKKTNVTPIHSRTFGIWNLTSATVRFAAAYDISNKPVYILAMLTYGIAWLHFMSEFFVFRTTILNGPIVSPMIVSTTSLVWMWTQWNTYL